LQDPSKWAALVVSLTFACAVDLGWDPTMHLKYNDRDAKFYYQITVTPDDNSVKRTYRSVRILSEFSADAIRGRATRVFEAYEIGDNGKRIRGAKNVAIKDFWLDSSRESEAVVLKKILKGAKKSMKAKFLTVVIWGKVSTDGNEDSTDRIMNGLKLGPRGYEDPDHPNPVQFYLRQRDSNRATQRSGASGLAPTPLSKFTPSVVRFGAKTHQRIVFKEVGHPIHDEKSIKTVFKAVRDAAEGQYKLFVPRIKPHYNTL